MVLHIQLTGIYGLVRQYREQYELPMLKVQFQPKRGWFMSLPATSAQLPAIFVQVTQQNKKFVFSTEEMISLSERNQEAQMEITLMTDRYAVKHRYLIAVELFRGWSQKFANICLACISCQNHWQCLTC